MRDEEQEIEQQKDEKQENNLDLSGSSSRFPTRGLSGSSGVVAIYRSINWTGTFLLHSVNVWFDR